MLFRSRHGRDPEIHPQEIEELVLGCETEMPPQRLLHLGRGPEVNRDPVGLPVGEGGPDPLAGSQALVAPPPGGDRVLG